MWTWSNEQSSSFVLRRQAHEALIHRLDAELVVGDCSPIDPLLAVDGVDEALRLMYCDTPAWGTRRSVASFRLRVAAALVAWSNL